MKETTTKSRPGLDGWLRRVDELLTEARPQAISPSLGFEGYEERWTTPMEDLVAGLEYLIRELVIRAGRWIVILEAARGRFAQFLVYEDGSVIAEVGSNQYLPADDQWTPDDEVTLTALGWQPPTPPESPNWRVVWPTVSPPVSEVAGLLMTTLLALYADTTEFEVKLWASRERGETPASSSVA